MEGWGWRESYLLGHTHLLLSNLGRLLEPDLKTSRCGPIPSLGQQQQQQKKYKRYRVGKRLQYSLTPLSTVC